jgi:glutathione S-transferase
MAPSRPNAAPMASLDLVSFHACPFVQRAAILLEEQGRTYDIRYIDLANKPDWFLAISPSGKVPVLKVDDTPIFESAVILEYLDETADDGRLLPAAPLGRAQQRMWITYISSIMSKGWQLQAAKDEETARGLAKEIRGHFDELAKNLPEDGPFWGGETFTMVDVAIAPILQRFTWAETLEPSLELFEGLPRVDAWRRALLERPSTTASILPNLEDLSGQMLHTIGSWVARGVVAADA